MPCKMLTNSWKGGVTCWGTGWLPVDVEADGRLLAGVQVYRIMFRGYSGGGEEW